MNQSSAIENWKESTRKQIGSSNYLLYASVCIYMHVTTYYCTAMHFGEY